VFWSARCAAPAAARLGRGCRRHAPSIGRAAAGRRRRPAQTARGAVGARPIGALHARLSIPHLISVDCASPLPAEAAIGARVSPDGQRLGRAAAVAHRRPIEAGAGGRGARVGGVGARMGAAAGGVRRRSACRHSPPPAQPPPAAMQAIKSTSIVRAAPARGAARR